MKSEPDEFSFSQLKRDKKTRWEGVRNYQARNFMTQSMSVGDLVLFYHSNAEPPGVAGLAKISAPAEPDSLQFDKKSDYFDPKAKKDKPTWFCVEVSYFKDLKRMVTLSELKDNPRLADMFVIKRGQRLSIQPITEKEYNEVIKMSEAAPEALEASR